MIRVSALKWIATIGRPLVSARLLSDAPPPTGGPTYLAQFIEDLKKRGFKEDGNLSDQNIFNLFQVEQRMIISDTKLKREYTRFLRAVHPDKFVNSSLDVRNKVEKLSSLFNDAYDTLRHPYKRAKYLLSLTIGKSQEELDKCLDSLELDEKFLSRMMELREQVELSRDQDLLLRISAEVEDDVRQLMRDLSDDIASYAKDKDATKLLEKLGKLKFLGNLHVILADRTDSFSTF